MADSTAVAESVALSTAADPVDPADPTDPADPADSDVSDADGYIDYFGAVSAEIVRIRECGWEGVGVGRDAEPGGEGAEVCGHGLQVATSEGVLVAMML